MCQQDYYGIAGTLDHPEVIISRRPVSAGDIGRNVSSRNLIFIAPLLQRMVRIFNTAFWSALRVVECFLRIIEIDYHAAVKYSLMM